MADISPFPKKVLVTAYDLEQIEHRGIAVFSKNLIRALHDIGCEVWLLTSAPHAPVGLVDTIFQHLSVRQTASARISFLRGLPGFHFFKKLLPPRIRHIVRNIIVGGGGNPLQSDIENITAITLSPHEWTGRFTYLNFVKGFVNAPNIFSGSIAKVEKQERPVSVATLDLQRFGFDGVIATCPLPIRFDLQGWRIQTVHDLIPIEIPSDHPWDDPKIFSSRVDAACQFSDLIVSVSHATADRMHALGFRPPAVCVLYQPKSFSDLPSAQQALVGSDYRRYLISVGSIEPRKNILTAIEAFLASDLPVRGIDYVVIGDMKSGADAKKIRSLADRHKALRLTGYVSDGERDALLRGAECLVFPSILEGYGIPLVDAIQSSKKIICSDIPVFREIAQNNAVFVSPKDVTAWANAFNALDTIRPATPNPQYEFAGFRASLADLLRTL